MRSGCFFFSFPKSGRCICLPISLLSSLAVNQSVSISRAIEGTVQSTTATLLRWSRRVQQLNKPAKKKRKKRARLYDVDVDFACAYKTQNAVSASSRRPVFPLLFQVTVSDVPDQLRGRFWTVMMMPMWDEA